MYGIFVVEPRGFVGSDSLASVIAKKVNLFTFRSVYAQQIVHCTAPFADTSCLICWLCNCTRCPQMLRACVSLRLLSARRGSHGIAVARIFLNSRNHLGNKQKIPYKMYGIFVVEPRGFEPLTF